MERRDVMAGAALGLGLMAMGNAQAAAEEKSGLTKLAKSASECAALGEACAAHCSAQMLKGDMSMAKCNAKVQEMMAMCKALVTLSSYNSAQLKKVAAVTADVCVECQKACEEHKKHFAMGMHLICKECGEACARCEKECRAA